MKEKEQEVKTFLVNMICDCGGFLVFSGRFKPSIENGKKLFIHKCTKCGKYFDLKGTYPKQKYESVRSDNE